MLARPLHRLLALVLAGALAGSLSVPASAVTPSPIVPGRTAMPTGGTNAVGPGINAVNANAQLAETIPASVKASWRARPPLCPQSAGSGARSTSVAGARTVVVERGYRCAYVSAYRTTDGSLLWRRQYALAESSHIAGSRVFVTTRDFAANGWYGQPQLDALDLATGRVLWRSPMPSTGGELISVGSGLVTAGTWVLDATTGAVRIKLKAGTRDLGGSHGQTLIAGGRIYHNSTSVLWAFSTSGALLWTRYKNNWDSPGHGNFLPQYSGGRLYIPSDAGTLALDPATGATRAVLPATDAPLAIDGKVGIFTDERHMEPTVMRAVNLISGSVYWKRALPGVTESLQPMTLWETAPVVANGLVWVLGTFDTGTPGRLLALDEVTGVIKSTTRQSCAGHQGYVTIAQGRIFTPSNCGVQTFVRR